MNSTASKASGDTKTSNSIQPRPDLEAQSETVTEKDGVSIETPKATSITTKAKVVLLLTLAGLLFGSGFGASAATLVLRAAPAESKTANQIIVVNVEVPGATSPVHAVIQMPDSTEYSSPRWHLSAKISGQGDCAHVIHAAGTHYAFTSPDCSLSAATNVTQCRSRPHDEPLDLPAVVRMGGVKDLFMGGVKDLFGSQVTYRLTNLTADTLDKEGSNPFTPPLWCDHEDDASDSTALELASGEEVEVDAEGPEPAPLEGDLIIVACLSMGMAMDNPEAIFEEIGNFFTRDVPNFFTSDVPNFFTNAATAIPCQIMDAVTNLLNGLIRALSDVAFGLTSNICSLIQGQLDRMIQSGQVKHCIRPELPACLFGDDSSQILNRNSDDLYPIEAFSRNFDDQGVTGTFSVSAKAELSMCVELRNASMDCAALDQRAQAEVSSWLQQKIRNPVIGAIDTVGSEFGCGNGFGRRLSEKEPQGVLEEVAHAALNEVADELVVGGRRKLLAHLDDEAQSPEKLDHRKSQILGKAIARGTQMLQQRLKKAVIGDDDNEVRRRLNNNELMNMGELVFNVSSTTSATVEAHATAAFEERMEMDLLARPMTDHNGRQVGTKPYRPLELDVNAPIVPGLLSLGFYAGLEARMPLVLQASLKAEGTVRAFAQYKKVYRVTVSAQSGATTNDVSNPDESGVWFDPLTAGVSAALSFSLGFQADLTFRISATVATVLTAYAEASAKIEAMAGTDAVLCVTNNLDFLCDHMNTRLTPYVEYSLDEVAAVTQGRTDGTRLIGLWAYVPYPQVYIKAGVSIGIPGANSAIRSLTDGQGLEVSYYSDFRHDAVLAANEAHPFGGYIARYANVWRLDAGAVNGQTPGTPGAPVGQRYVARSENYASRSWKVVNDDTIRIDASGTGFQIVTPGLTGAAGTVSFVEVARPGYFLRHYYYTMRCHSNDNSEAFKSDATFRPRAAFTGTAGYVAYESVNFPGQFIRHVSEILKLDALSSDSSALAKSDASFMLVSADDA